MIFVFEISLVGSSPQTDMTWCLFQVQWPPQLHRRTVCQNTHQDRCRPPTKFTTNLLIGRYERRHVTSNATYRLQPAAVNSLLLAGPTIGVVTGEGLSPLHSLQSGAWPLLLLH